MANAYGGGYGSYGFAQGASHTSSTVNSKKYTAIIKYVTE